MRMAPPNASRWRYDIGGHGWGNGELQFYTSSRSKNAWIEDGTLIVEARKESWGGSDYTSTRLLSREEWTPSEIRGYVNETQYFTFANERLTNSQANDRHWPFDHPFHLIFNIAVGGAWGGQQGVDPDIWPQRLQVDYVRVYGCAGVVSTESEELPESVRLDQNYPNPFNPGTTIRYALPQAGNVRLAVYDVVGREVAVLVDGVRVQGAHTEIFKTPGLPTGMYVYVLSTPETVLTKRMLLVK